MSKFVLVDTGYWYGLFTPADQHAKDAKVIADVISHHKLIIPFPSMYEFLNTKFVKNKTALNIINELFHSNRVQLIYDDKYRDAALIEVFTTHKTPRPNLSLVDCIIREILKDVNVNISALVTFNKNDFYDLCAKRNIDVLG